MKKKQLLFCIMAVCLLAFAPMAKADYFSVTISAGSWQTGQGGEFALKADDALLSILTGYSTDPVTLAGHIFQTFCIEHNEYIGLPGDYKATIGPGAINGGIAGQSPTSTSPDPVSMGTAWLYSQFAAGNLTGYNYGGDRKASASLLQEAIWTLEDELGAYNPATTNIFIKAAVNKYSDWTGAHADSNGAFGVRALNLFGKEDPTELHQSQLVVTTPIPAAVWLLGSGLLGLFGIRRRFSK